MDGVRLGIDFGTSNTVAVLSVPERGTRPLVFDGSPLLPSAVCADATGQLLVGRDAWHVGLANPAGLEPHPKRHIDEDTLLLGTLEVPVEEVIAAVLRRVAAEAARVAGEPVSEAVVTYPASWAAPRRERLRAAASLVFPDVHLVPEPAAAASYFAALPGGAVPEGKCVLVYDLGAGTFDASVVRSSASGFEVLDSHGLPDAGGLDIDAAIVAYLAATFTARDAATWRRLASPATPGDRRASRLLWDGVRGGKEMLSRTTTTMLHVPLFDEEVPLGRDQLDELARPTLERTVAATRAVLRATGRSPAQVARVFLVGGSSRMPLIATLLHRSLDIVPTIIDQPEVVVAEGSLGTPPAPVPSKTDQSWPPPAAVAELSAAPARRPRRLVAAVAAAAVLAAGAAVAVLLAGPHGAGGSASASRSAGGSARPSPAPSLSSTADPCLVGSWRATEYQITNHINGNDVVFTGPGVSTLTYTADGRFVENYNGTPMTARASGANWSHIVLGTITGRYRATGGTIYASDISSRGTWKVLRNGRQNNSGSLEASLEAPHYTCSGNSLVEQASFYIVKMTRA